MSGGRDVAGVAPTQAGTSHTRALSIAMLAIAIAGAAVPAARAALAPAAIGPLAQAAAPEVPPAAADRENAAAIAAATQASEKWLNAVDTGNLVDTWQEAAEVFKLGISQADWIADLEAIRTRLGKATMRELKATQYSTTLRGAPSRGDYVTLSFLTKFANVPLAAETLIVSKEADGVWRIAGYNIGKAPDQ
jgi:hypothetical protein